MPMTAHPAFNKVGLLLRFPFQWTSRLDFLTGLFVFQNQINSCSDQSDNIGSWFERDEKSYHEKYLHGENWWETPRIDQQIPNNNLACRISTKFSSWSYWSNRRAFENCSWIQNSTSCWCLSWWISHCFYGSSRISTSTLRFPITGCYKYQLWYA